MDTMQVPFCQKLSFFLEFSVSHSPARQKGLAPRRKALIFLGTSLPLPQLRREHDLPRLRALGPDEAVVSLGNAPGDGEPHTEAAVGGTGLIRPIEPVKELLCLPLGQRFTGIAAPQDDARFVFFSSAAMTSGETYTLTSGGTELATATAGGTGTAAVTTPDTSADTADTHQTSDSHAGLYIALGAVAVLGAAAAVVVVVLRKQKKA